MRVTLLCGGPGDERNISLISGRAVADALIRSGHHVFVSDISPNELSALDVDAEVIFPVLHGAFGESGELQAELEARGLAFVGSGSKASQLGMDKAAAKQRWTNAGLCTPDSFVLTAANADAIERFPLPCIVKPVDSGSSVGVYRCDVRPEARVAMQITLENRDMALVERFISGVELTIGLLDGKPLPPIRIETGHALFDYDAKYRSRDTKHLFDTGLSDAVLEQATKDATRAYRLLGCRDLARIDLIVDDTGTPWLLEINTMPGFTPTSLLPEAAARVGIGFDELCDRLVHRAAARASEAEPLRAAV